MGDFCTAASFRRSGRAARALPARRGPGRLLSRPSLLAANLPVGFCRVTALKAGAGSLPLLGAGDKAAGTGFRPELQVHPPPLLSITLRWRQGLPLTPPGNNALGGVERV